MVAIPFATQSYPSDSRPLTSERLVNLFAEVQPDTAKSRVLIRPTPGLTLVNTLPEFPVHAMIVQRTEWFAVAGNSLYRVGTTGTVTFCGAFAPDAGAAAATMAVSATQVAVCCPPYLYVWNSVTNVFVEVTDPLPSASSVAFVDGFFVVSENGGGGRFWVSDAYDATSFQPLSYATTESNPDFILRAVGLRSEVWFLGQASTEVWDSVGGSFPLQRNSGATFQRGCRSQRSIAVGDNSVFWLGDDLIVYRSQGYAPVRISTWALEQRMLRSNNMALAQGFCTNHGGHIQYVLTFGSAGQTWCYDVASGLWFERTSSTTRWRGNSAVRFAGNQIIGDSISGKVFRLDVLSNLEDGVDLIRTAVLPPIYAENKRVFMSRLELSVETGTGAPVGVTLEVSDDGGRNFRAFEGRDTGGPGDYRRRIVWNRLGSFRERTLRFTFQGDARPAIFGCEAELQQGAV